MTTTTAERMDHFIASANDITKYARSVALRYMQMADADDVAQDVLIEAWLKDLDRWNPQIGKLIPFVGNRVTWKVADSCRTTARYRKRFIQLDNIGESEHPVDDSAERIADMAHVEVVALMTPRLLSIAMKSLGGGAKGKRARNIVKLIDLKCHDFSTVSRRIGIHSSNVSRARGKALKKMRSALEAVGVDSPARRSA